MQWNLKGSKAILVSDREAVLHGQMSVMLCICILAISDGDTDSTLVGAVDGAGMECLGVGKSRG